MKYFIRDFDRADFQVKEERLRRIAAEMNEKYGEGRVEVEITESYRNMREMVEPCYQLVEYALAATKAAGVEPDVAPIRGGTDGARLSFKGLPCPNLGTGGHAYHGPYEHITVEGMDKSVDVMMELVKLYAKYI